jgi:hypothetical protein
MLHFCLGYLGKGHKRPKIREQGVRALAFIDVKQTINQYPYTPSSCLSDGCYVRTGISSLILLYNKYTYSPVNKFKLSGKHS